MFKLSTSRTLIATSIFALLAGCASNNPYDNQQGQQGGSSNKTAIYGGLGALGGAVVGAASSSKKDRKKGALIGAAVAGAAGAGYGYYVDKQEAELRRSRKPSSWTRRPSLPLSPGAAPPIPTRPFFPG